MSASPWVIGWNHIARRLIVESPGFPNDAKRPLELARAIAHMTYRNDSGLSRTQGVDKLSGMEIGTLALPMGSRHT